MITHQNSTNHEDRGQVKFIKKPNFEVDHPSKTYISLDHALLYAGDNSTFSKRVLYVVSFYWIWYSFLFMGVSLLMGRSHIFFCPASGANGYIPCDQHEACKNFSPDQIMIEPAKTIVSEFELICSREYLVPWVNSMLFLSLILSGPIFPYLTNKYGRKWTIICSGFLSSVSLIFAGLTWNFNVWMFFVFIAGMGFAGLETAGRVYLSELSGNNFRINSMAVLNMVWAGSQILLVLLKALVSYWRYLFIYFMGGSFLIAVIFGAFFLEESPKYLLLTDRISVRSPGVQTFASAHDHSQPTT